MSRLRLAGPAKLATEFSLDAGVGAYRYPGLAESGNYKLYATISRPTGMLTASGEFAWMPEQDSIGGEDNRYIRGSVSAPLPFAQASLNVGVGWEDGAFGDDKVDWLAGVSVPLKPFALRVSYIGTDADYGDFGDDSIVAELHWKFDL